MYIHTHTHTQRHISNSDAAVPYDERFHGHDRVWHVSPATPQHNWLTLGFLTCSVATELLVLHSVIFYCRTLQCTPRNVVCSVCVVICNL